jgi:hypothetical protein
MILRSGLIVVIGLATHDGAEQWARYFGIGGSRSVHPTCGVWYSGEVWGWQWSIRCTVPYLRPPIGVHDAGCNVIHSGVGPCPPRCDDAQHVGQQLVAGCPSCGSHILTPEQQAEVARHESLPDPPTWATTGDTYPRRHVCGSLCSSESEPWR